MIDWLRSLFDKDHSKDRVAVRRVVDHALHVAKTEAEASRKARRKLELELEARRRAR